MVKNVFLVFFPAVLLSAAVCARAYLSWTLARSALLSLVRRFRELEALDPGAAVSAEELGLRAANPEGDWLKSAAISRSYKPQVLLHLIAWKAVRMAGDNRYYLSEDTLCTLDLP